MCKELNFCITIGYFNTLFNITYFHSTTTIYTINSIMYFELENDEMASSKRRSIFISLIFTLKCFNRERLEFFDQLFLLEMIRSKRAKPIFNMSTGIFAHIRPARCLCLSL